MTHNLTRTNRQPDTILKMIDDLLEEEHIPSTLYIMGDPGFGISKDNICIHSPEWRTNAYLYHRTHPVWGALELRASIPCQKVIFTTELGKPDSIDNLLKFLKGWRAGTAPTEEDDHTAHQHLKDRKETQRQARKGE